MTRYADPERCPDCLSAMPYGASRCPSCGLRLEGPLAAELFVALSTADDLLRRMRVDSVAPVPVTTGAGAQPGARTGDAGGSDLVVPAGHGPTTRTTDLEGSETPGAPPARDVSRHGGLSGASVPKILLGLGALCLLVAALVFLAVAWSAMGVAGRTATLVGFTVLAGGLTALVARRDLRAAAESLGVVTLGLLAFDLFGARDAGWFGQIGTSGFLVVLGAVLAVAGAGAARAARRTPVQVLTGAEVIAVLGIATAVGGSTGLGWLTWSSAVTLAVVVTAVVAAAARIGHLPVLAHGAAVLSVGSWVVLVTTGLERALISPTLEQLWLGLEVWPLLAATALAGAAAAVPRLPSVWRLLAAGAGFVTASAVLLAPVTDETATAASAACAALLAGLAGLTWVLPKAWRPALAGAIGLCLGWTVMAAMDLLGAAVVRILDAGAVLWAGGGGDTFPARSVTELELAGGLLPVMVMVAALALVAAARTFPAADRLVAPLLDLDVVAAATVATAALTLALHPVPIALVVAVLLLGGVLLAARSVRGASALRLSLALVLIAPALQLSLHAEWLTLPTLVVLLGAAALVHLRTPSLEVSVAAGAVASAAVAGAGWTVGALAVVPSQWTALAVLLALAAMVLGVPYVDEPHRLSGPAGFARLGIELGALVAGAVVALAGVDLARPPASEPSWFAVYLTVMGAAVSAVALLRADRRSAGWLGGFLLAAATWVRLAELGVDSPEAYTLPTATALLVVGLVHLRRNADAGTMTALSPGLALALVPSLLWVLVDPLGLRSVVLGLATLALVVAGLRLRWSAPLVHGAVVGAVLVLRLATPVADAVPRWALIGAAGALLVALGITWEQRLRDARAVAGYLRRLR